MRNVPARLGRRMKEIRTVRDMTQEKLAEKARISTRYLSRLELGEQSPSIRTVERIADALGVEIWELFAFAQEGSIKDLQSTARKLLGELDEKTLRIVVKMVRALAR